MVVAWEAVAVSEEEAEDFEVVPVEAVDSVVGGLEVRAAAAVVVVLVVLAAVVA